MRFLVIGCAIMISFSSFLVSAADNDMRQKTEQRADEIKIEQPRFFNDDSSYEDLVDEMDHQGFLEPKKESRLVSYLQVVGCYVAIKYMNAKESFAQWWKTVCAWFIRRSESNQH